MKQSECDKQCRVIVGLMIFITFIGIFVGLVIGRMMGLSEKRNPSEEHQQVMERLGSVERACGDIGMHLQNKTELEEHQQVMERLGSVERACSDIGMHLQNKTELEEPSQFVVGCYSGNIMSDYCMVYFDSVVDNFTFNSKGYFNNPTVIDKDGQYRQFCNQEIPRNQFDFGNEYKKCKYPKKK